MQPRLPPPAPNYTLLVIDMVARWAVVGFGLSARSTLQRRKYCT